MSRIVIAPTEVQEWSRCPQRWWYQREGWRAPQGTWRPEMTLGSALHVGLARWWKDGLESSLQAAVTLQAYLTDNWPDDQQDSLDGMVDLMLKAFKATVTWSVKNIKGSPLLIEQPLGCGNSGEVITVASREDPTYIGTPDLVTQEPQGIVVTDWKYAHYCAPDSIQYRLDGTNRSHQLRHYAYFVGRHLHRPVSLVRKVVIAGLPKILVRSSEHALSVKELQMWFLGARQKWQEMNGAKQGMPIYRREEGCKPFGDKYPCEYYDACWTCHGDETEMKNFYQRKEA